MFSERLKKLIGEEETRKFARRCDVNEATIRKLIKGGTDPSFKVVKKIAEACQKNQHGSRTV